MRSASIKVNITSNVSEKARNLRKKANDMSGSARCGSSVQENKAVCTAELVVQKLPEKRQKSKCVTNKLTDRHSRESRARN